MIIISWNVNSIKARISSIEDLIKHVNPDILCLQETKILDEKFPVTRFKDLGYQHIIFRGQKSYNGVAIISKIPIQKYFFLTIYNQDARHICATINNIDITNIYIPAGGDQPDVKLNPKFYHKLQFLSFLERWFVTNLDLAKNKHILLGDFNIAPHEHDVWSSRALRDVVSHTFIERENLLAFQNKTGFIDIFRNKTNLDEKIYSWWSYRNKDWKKSNRGRRLDHIWITPNLSKNISHNNILKFTRDWVSPSDHVPCLIEISHNT